MIYGYCRVSTNRQKLERQITNISHAFPNAIIKTEKYTGTTQARPEWTKLKKCLSKDDTCVFDSVSRMSRNAEEGFKDYKELYEKGITLVFLNEPHISTTVFKEALGRAIPLTGTTIDYVLEGINRYLLELAKEQIRLAFEQSEKEVEDLHTRIAQGIRESKARGTQIGLVQGTKLNTKKSIKCKEIIKTHSKSFGGSLSDIECMKLCGISRNSYYKYKKELEIQIK